MDHRIFNVRTGDNVVLMIKCDSAIAHGGVRMHLRVCIELTLGEKSLTTTGNQTCLSGVPARRSTNWATSPPKNVLLPCLKYAQENENICTFSVFLGQLVSSLCVPIKCLRSFRLNLQTQSHGHHIISLEVSEELQTLPLDTKPWTHHQLPEGDGTVKKNFFLRQW